MASVGGAAEARYVLDTGSDVHLLNEDLADELGLTKVPGEEGTDHAGTTMPSWSVGDVEMALGGIALTLRDVVSIPAPPPFPGFGIRGILSPQHLHASAWAVLDLVGDELLLVDGTDEELSAFLHVRAPTLSLLELPRDPAHKAVVVPVSIEGVAEVPTLIDTGGRNTEISAAAMPGVAIAASGRLGGGVSGADYVGGSVGKHLLAVQGHRVAMPEVHARENMPGIDALIGMDVLRGTVLACTAELTRPVFWVIG
jgi:hypothetical protein